MDLPKLFNGLEEALHALENTEAHQVIDIEIRSIQNDYCYAEVQVMNGKVIHFSFTTRAWARQQEEARKRSAQIFGD